MFFQSGRRASQAKELWYPYWMMVSHTHMLSFRIQFFEYLTCFISVGHFLCVLQKAKALSLSFFSLPLFFWQVWITPIQT